MGYLDERFDVADSHRMARRGTNTNTNGAHRTHRKLCYADAFDDVLSFARRCYPALQLLSPSKSIFVDEKFSAYFVVDRSTYTLEFGDWGERGGSRTLSEFD